MNITSLYCYSLSSLLRNLVLIANLPRNKVIAVTGSSSGIGRVIAARCAHEGATVVLHHRGDTQSLADAECLHNELTQSGPVILDGQQTSHLVIGRDLTSGSAGSDLINQTVSAFGRADVLVNNAGICQFTPAGSVTKQSLAKHMNINFMAAYLLTQAATQQMIRQGRGGSVVSISSTTARFGSSNLSHYGPTKAALVAMSKFYAVEFGKHGIRYNCVLPVTIQTAMNERDLAANEQTHNQLINLPPKDPPPVPFSNKTPPPQALVSDWKDKIRRTRHRSPLSDSDRDQIDTSTSLVLHDLSNSISTLSSAEALRHETATSILRKKYGRSVAGRVLAKWAAGSGALDGESEEGKSEEQVKEEEGVRVMQVVRESVVWFLRRGLEDVVSLQRGLVERRIERVSERERSVLFKVETGASNARTSATVAGGSGLGVDDTVGLKGVAIDETEARAIEEELSAEQLQLFEAENDAMVRYYEDTLSKVQNAEKSLLEISSLQQTLVSHLSTQEEYIGQLVTDAASTETNIGRGNKELKRASERRSAAQAVFWGTVGLCTSLIVWDLIF
ncbi:hypothetical protein ANOM_004389 [Aspergillus nomiae NRRL 13137]|uniref:t-SNARE coiled-coil homology domain-containing protein n=1 Tax=Aspergillus nomiae NRRL (strain ATCC 15546 / NRRL 13137 / CBS 260.88 / M93) TaxID=1509407 RepID=A0A0L1J7A1_ASPN3|nr:uncharacterized protein ANOM_004389 [Aspergillus nomiae NRRL 13137]KNG87545.1 hypothetical protein ANOM_004389 [Aspergillus nomiae NRRL 13137]